ncbi:hypothetical protein QTP88_014436 [Uroleucon formosanum]
MEQRHIFGILPKNVDQLLQKNSEYRSEAKKVITNGIRVSVLSPLLFNAYAIYGTYYRNILEKIHVSE